ncbi:TetR/AcrR family transcriptional regulator [Nocardia sp. FBN12]|uniref:TetR/AcrR family transcriptional regulator n=1 Tax=Nocardia sp. FBN12 TaxID=3419766 RepID=UPI003D003B51
MGNGTDLRTHGHPPRGKRPANRRQLILRAAATLFCRNGYANVGVGEVADAVAIGPSALYRHFQGKQDLLAAVVSDALNTLNEALAAATADDLATRLAAAALADRDIGVLVRRESRHLSVDHRRLINASINGIGSRTAELISERRPDLGTAEADLLAWCTLAATSSVSFHSLSLPEPEFATLLAELITTVVESPIALTERNPEATADRGSMVPRSRREAILTEATRLFARNGFANVSMEEIGSGVGIAGPSVYNHFSVKSDVLSAAMFRGDAWLRIDMNRAFARSTDPRECLHRLLGSYQEFVFENAGLVQLLVSESMYLPDADRHRARAAQHEYVAEWVHLVTTVHPDWDAVSARIRVQAAQTMMNDIALMPPLRARPGVDTALLTIGARLLAIGDSN